MAARAISSGMRAGVWQSDGMNVPPGEIDGARVLEWAWSDEPFGVVTDTDGRVAYRIHGLAICRYEGSERVYRFACDGAWECVQDALYDSLGVAKAQLPDQYRLAPAEWRGR